MQRSHWVAATATVSLPMWTSPFVCIKPIHNDTFAIATAMWTPPFDCNKPIYWQWYHCRCHSVWMNLYIMLTVLTKDHFTVYRCNIKKFINFVCLYFEISCLQTLKVNVKCQFQIKILSSMHIQSLLLKLTIKIHKDHLKVISSRSHEVKVISDQIDMYKGNFNMLKLTS